MPLGILRTVDQRVQLGPEAFDDAEIARERKADRGPLGLPQELFDFDPRCARTGDRRAGWCGTARRSPDRACSRSAPQTAPRAARAGCLRRTCGIDGAQDTAFEVGAAVVRIEIFTGERIPRDRVDREVAAAGRFLDGHVGVAGHLEAAMAASDLRFAPRHRHVEVRDLVDGEAFADGVDRAERGEHVLEPIRGEAVDLEIDILRVASEQPVADPAADDQGAAACVADAARDCHCCFEFGIHESHTPAAAGIGFRPKRFTTRSQRPGARALRMTRARERRWG